MNIDFNEDNEIVHPPLPEDVQIMTKRLMSDLGQIHPLAEEDVQRMAKRLMSDLEQLKKKEKPDWPPSGYVISLTVSSIIFGILFTLSAMKYPQQVSAVFLIGAVCDLGIVVSSFMIIIGVDFGQYNDTSNK